MYAICLDVDKLDQFVTMVLKGGICHFTKWQIRPFISKRTILRLVSIAKLEGLHANLILKKLMF